MLNTKQYLIISAPTGEAEQYHDGYYVKLKLKVVTGFTADNLQDSLNIQTNWTPVGGNKDKLFFFPGCSVPRFKVREHFNCTIKLENATAAFVSKENMEGGSVFNTYNHLFPFDYHEVKDFMNGLEDKAAKTLFFSFPYGKFEKIFFDESLWHINYWHVTNQLSSKNISEVMSNSATDKNYWSFKYVKKEPQYRLIGIDFSKGVPNVGMNVYFEDEILKVLNQDNFIIDNEKYHELRAFGNTLDKENIILMMELMANCNFQKSIVYLFLLVKEFNSEIFSHKEAEHVNFKSLLSFLGIDAKTNISPTDVISSLKRNHLYTHANATLLASAVRGYDFAYDEIELETV